MVVAAMDFIVSRSEIVLSALQFPVPRNWVAHHYAPEIARNLMAAT